MLKKVFSFQSNTIFGAAFVLGAASLISSLLGVLRDRILAGKFGAGDELDVYYAAFQIPDLVFALLALGTISAGFIPVFADYLNKKSRSPKDHWYLANNILNLIGLALAFTCVFLAILAPVVIKIVAPGFGAEKLALTVKLARVMFFSPFLLGLSAIFSGILQSFRRFLAYSLAPIFYNFGIIFGALFLTGRFGLLGLAYGVVLGALSHFLSQLFVALGCGWRFKLVFDFRFAGVKRVFRLMPYRFLSLALSQIDIWARTFFASFLAAGSIAVYNLSYNIWSFPYGIFGVSFSLAAFPKLSKAAQDGNIEKFRRMFARVFRQIMFFTLPSSALFIVLGRPIVRVVFGTGKFDERAIILTSATMGLLMISLVAESLILLYLRGFFSFENTKTPLVISLTATVLRLGLVWFLSSQYGLMGLALGFSLGSFIYLGLLSFFLRKKVGPFGGGEIMLPGLKMFVCALVAGLAAHLIFNFSASLALPENAVMIFTRGAVSGGAGVLLYLLSARLLGLEVKKLIHRASRKKI